MTCTNIPTCTAHYTCAGHGDGRGMQQLLPLLFFVYRRITFITVHHYSNLVRRESMQERGCCDMLMAIMTAPVFSPLKSRGNTQSLHSVDSVGGAFERTSFMLNSII